MTSTRRALPECLGDVIRRHRESAGWTQEGFADEIEMHRAQYGLIERGKKDLRLSSLERVAAGLKVPLSTILREAEDA